MGSKVNRYDWLFVGITGILLGLIPYLLNDNYYFIDDAQQEFMPAFYNIGRTLHEGSLPILSLTNWFGGNYLAEYQYALYNPVSLLTYYLLPSISSLAVAATLLACFYQGVLASGTYVLARSYRISRPASWLAALTIVTNNFISYWYASAWPPLLIATAWFVWAWAFLIRSEKSTGEWLLSVCFTYLMFTAGSPHTDLAFGFLTLIIFILAVYKRNYAQIFAISSSLLVSALLCAPTYIPLFAVHSLMGRAHSVFNQSFLVPNLYDLMAFSSPFFQGYMNIYNYPIDSMVPHNGLWPTYTAYKLTSTPFMYCAWYYFPLLPFIAWRKIDWKNSSICTLIALAFMLIIATQGPDHFNMLQAPFRFIPYFHIALVMLFLKLLTAEDFLAKVDRRSIRWSAALIILSGIMALQKRPEGYLFVEMGILMCLVGFFAFLLTANHDETTTFFMLCFSVVIFFVITHATYPPNGDLVDWHMSSNRGKNPLKSGTFDTYSLYDGGAGNPNLPGRLDEFQTGYMPIENGIAEINGYSSILHGKLDELLCMTVFGETCPQVASRLFEVDQLSGMTMIDLFQITRIVVMKGPHLDALRPYLNKDWHMETDGEYTQTFTRPDPHADLPGMLIMLPRGSTVTVIKKPRPLVEKYEINHRSGKNDHVIFSRLWWPGYKAWYDGVEVPIHAEKGVFVTVDLPDSAATSGRLVLRYEPPDFLLSIILCIGGGMLCLGMIAFRSRMSFMRASAASPAPRSRSPLKLSSA